MAPRHSRAEDEGSDGAVALGQAGCLAGTHSSWPP